MVSVTDRVLLIVFIVAVVAGGSAIGVLTAPGEWYAGLEKPPFNPPNWIFGPVWTILYVMIAIAGWRAWRLDRGDVLMVVWWVQLMLNYIWSPIFFAAQNPPLALVVIVTMLGAILTFIVLGWRRVSAVRALCGVGRLRHGPQPVHRLAQLSFRTAQFHALRLPPPFVIKPQRRSHGRETAIDRRG